MPRPRRHHERRVVLIVLGIAHRAQVQEIADDTRQSRPGGEDQGRVTRRRAVIDIRLVGQQNRRRLALSAIKGRLQRRDTVPVGDALVRRHGEQR